MKKGKQDLKRKVLENETETSRYFQMTIMTIVQYLLLSMR